MTTPQQTAAQRQFLVSVSGIPGYFATKTGGNVSAPVTQVWDGGAPRSEPLAGSPSAENVTIGRPFKPLRDAALVKRLRAQVSELTATVTVTPTDRNLVPIAEPTVYPDALLVGVNDPEADAASGDAARFELTFAIGDYT